MNAEVDSFSLRPTCGVPHYGSGTKLAVMSNVWL